MDAPADGIAADSLAPKRVGEAAFAIARAHVAPEVVLVRDEAIRRAQAALWSGLRIVAELGGAAVTAQQRGSGWRCWCVGGIRRGWGLRSES